MPEIPHRFEFEPSPASLKKWLGTRKAPFEISGVKYPGYFSTSGYSADAVWFTLAVAIETAALLIIVLGGLSKGGVFLVGSIIAALLMLVFDFVGADWAHDQVDEICKLRNQLALAEHTASKKALSDKIGALSMTGKRIAGYALIILSAVLKIMSLFLLASFDLALILIMTLLYNLVIYVHIKHTMYYWIERSLRKKEFPRDYAQWSERHHSSGAGGKKGMTSEIEADPCRAKERPYEFSSEVPLSMMNDVIRVGDHQIRPGNLKGERDGVENGEKLYHYTLIAKGVLLDSDIPLLTQANSGRKADVIAKACVYLQTTSYQG